jgi:hypothetical protein
MTDYLCGCLALYIAVVLYNLPSIFLAVVHQRDVLNRDLRFLDPFLAIVIAIIFPVYFVIIALRDMTK